MEQSFDIILTEQWLEVFPVSALLDTEFYVVCDGVAFPGEGWTDSALSIVSMWIEDIVRHNKYKKTAYILYFMDGPYWLEVQQNGQKLEIKGIEDKKEKEVKFTFSCTVQELIKKLKKTLYKLERMIQTNEKCTDWQDAFLPAIDHYKEVLHKIEE